MIKKIVGLLLVLGMASGAAAYDYEGETIILGMQSNQSSEDYDQIGVMVNDEVIFLFEPVDGAAPEYFANEKRKIFSECGATVYPSGLGVLLECSNSGLPAVEFALSFSTHRTYGYGYLSSLGYEQTGAFVPISWFQILDTNDTEVGPIQALFWLWYTVFGDCCFYHSNFGYCNLMAPCSGDGWCGQHLQGTGYVRRCFNTCGCNEMNDCEGPYCNECNMSFCTSWYLN